MWHKPCGGGQAGSCQNGEVGVGGADSSAAQGGAVAEVTQPQLQRMWVSNGELDLYRTRSRPVFIFARQMQACGMWPRVSKGAMHWHTLEHAKANQKVSLDAS